MHVGVYYLPKERKDSRKSERKRKMILVTGATGLNGRELVRRLSARGVSVRALVRGAARAKGFFLSVKGRDRGG